MRREKFHSAQRYKRQYKKGKRHTLIHVFFLFSPERARSISPTKDSPLSSTSDLNFRLSKRSSVVDPPLDLRPTPPRNTDCSDAEFQTTPADASTSNESTNNRAPLVDSSSGELDPASDGKATAMPPENPSMPSRAEISQALEQKDPSWFRQTPDRGVGSLAYRRSVQDVSASDSPSLNGTGRMKLPGLSRELTAESEKPESGTDRSRSPSRTSSTHGTSSASNRFSSISSVSTTGLGWPVPLSAQRQERKGDQTASDDRTPLSPGRSSPERSSSPTKGLGGFVQSAMMKRSDSVSKRGSVHAGTGFARSNAALGNRRSVYGDSLGSAAESRTAREPSPMDSRPSSSHSEATVVQPQRSGETGASDSTRERRRAAGDGSSPSRSHARSLSSISIDIPKSPESNASRSPTRSETKRWSPTKATWLESALNRPESPRSKSPAVQQSLAWLKDLNRSRQSKSSVDLGKLTPSKDESFAGRAGTRDNSPEKRTEDAATAPTEDQSPVKEIEPEPASRAAETPSKPEVPSKKPEVLPLRSTSSTTSKLHLDTPSPKPKQPGTIDFKSSLRRTETNSESTAKEEPEFKNVFNKLRKTERSTYKPPDELKENIVRGKAALNATGGPRKTERVDELRESLLKQREAIKAGGGSSRPAATDSDRRQPDPLPEALSKRANLMRVDTSKSPSSSIPASPLADRSPSPLKDSPFKLSKPDLSKPSSPSKDNPAEELAKPLEAPAPRNDPPRGKVDPVSSGPSTVSDASAAPTAIRGPAAKGSLAGRLNPNLANVLARGPPGVGGGASGTKTAARKDPPTTGEQGDSVPTSSGPLTPLTKGRARGPKRRLPTSAAQNAKASAKEERPATVSEKSVPSTSPRPEPFRQTEDQAPSTPAKDSPPIPPKASWRPKPAVAAKSPELAKSETLTQSPDVSKKDESAFETPSKRSTGPEVPPKLSTVQKATCEETPTHSSSAKPTPPPKSASLPSPDSTSSSPSFATRLREGLANQSKLGLGGIGSSFFQNNKQDSPKESGANASKVAGAPPVPPKPADISTDTAGVDHRQPVTSPIPRTSESTRVISDFFKTLPKSSDRVEIDPQLLVTAELNTPKIRTIKKQIWEITGDGKRQDLPVNQEYIMFEGSMYLCVHTYETIAGSKTDVYLWCGDEVSEAAIEDAQLFARKVARENGTRLEVLRQGKEPASFVQALGGIMITRRGSSSRSSSSALYMLCGRRHLGQIVFDEVDFKRENLCSAFTFVISAPFGKLYLWKGKGSGADEIGGARLIGMALGLTGEMEEVSEGEEPESFFEVFPEHKSGLSPTSPTPPPSSPSSDDNPWHLKAKHEKFRCRLLRIDHELGQRVSFWSRRTGTSSPVTRPNDTVQEIEPFCQKDLRTRDIYILDTFFELYV